MFIGIVSGLVAGLLVLMGYKYVMSRKEPNHECVYFSVSSFLSDIEQRDHDFKDNDYYNV